MKEKRRRRRKTLSHGNPPEQIYIFELNLFRIVLIKIYKL